MKFDMGRRKDFKSETDFLKDVFARNREAITKVYGKGAEETFIDAVQSMKVAKEINIRQVLNELSRSNAFTPKGDIMKENAIQGLKSWDLYQDFRNLTRDEKTGRFTKVDYSKLKWDKESSRYVYDGRVAIVFNDSPQGVSLFLI